jgi:hypothetical protein
MPIIEQAANLLTPFGGTSIILDPALYPTSAGNYQLFTTAWDANDTNLTSPTHAATTFTVPNGVRAIRVLVWGSGCTQVGTAYSPGNGGFIDTIIPTLPGDKYKAIVAGGGTAFNSFGGVGASGVGGGAAQDGNDIGSGGAGSGFFYAFNSANTIVSTEAEMFSKGCLIAGGGGTYLGDGMSGTQSNITFSGISGVGRDGARGAASGGGGGRASAQGGDSGFDTAGTFLRAGGTDGNGGIYANDQYGNNYGNGSGGGRGAGGASSGQSGGGRNGENATGTGGRGGIPANSLNSSGFGKGGTGPGGGGNGSIFNGIKLGGGGGGSHGSPAAAGGWSGGGSAYCCSNQGGGGGSGVAFGSLITPTLSGWTNPASVSVRGGNSNSVCAVPGTSGQGRVVNGTGYPGAILVMW